MAMDQDSRSVTAALAQTVEAQAAQAAEIAALREVTLQAMQESLALHSETREVLGEMRREMEHMKRSLKALGTARA